MPKYILQELPGEMTDGRKVVYPKMQTYSLPTPLQASPPAAAIPTRCG